MWTIGMLLLNTGHHDDEVVPSIKQRQKSRYVLLVLHCYMLAYILSWPLRFGKNLKTVDEATISFNDYTVVYVMTTNSTQNTY